MLDEILSLARKDEYTLDGYTEADPTKYKRAIPQDSLRSHYRKLAITMIKGYGGIDTIPQEMYKQFITEIAAKRDTKLKTATFVSDLSRLSAFKSNRLYKYNIIDEYHIETYKELWTSKTITWMNVSVTGGNAAFKLYDKSNNALIDTNSILPALTISYNYFKRSTKNHNYLYFRTGAGFRRVNSLNDIPKFDYKKETIIAVSPTEQLKSEKSGTAYEGTLEHGFGFELPLEAYWSPWKYDAIPGLYGKLQYNYGSPWINKNKIALDLGVIWNIVSSEKDSKNILTIVPFISWTSLMKEYRDVAKTMEKKPSENFLVGVRFGVPVNLGK